MYESYIFSTIIAHIISQQNWKGPLLSLGEPQHYSEVRSRLNDIVYDWLLHMLEKLKGSKYGADEQIKQISDRFDETTKKTFRSSEDVCLIAFGTTMDKDVQYGIRSGKLKVPG